MNIFIWTIFGLISSLVAIRFSPRKSSVLGTILVGVLGAILGGYLATVYFDGANELVLKIGSLVVALGAAAIILILERTLVKR